MINQVFQLVSPKVFDIRIDQLSFADKVIVRPEYLSICHADQRYHQGTRDTRILAKKLPMALIHECSGRVVYDPTGKMRPGQKVVCIPNVPGDTQGVLFENYAEGSAFLSSGLDGFTRELVEIDPDRVIPSEGVAPEVACITEFVSVAVHAATRFLATAHTLRGRIGIWGDGSLAFVLANVLKALAPESKIIVVGRQHHKLAQFSFVDETYFSSDLPEGFKVDHGFECCGGESSYDAIDDIIRVIRPQGTVVLLGVSENKIAINTRMVLEKGLTLIGCSRSGRTDFEKAVELMRKPSFQSRLKRILIEDEPVSSIEGLQRVFANDLTTPFKTVFKWNV